MIVYRSIINLLSPTIVSSESSWRLIRHSGSYISGLTFRGAFLTALMREGVDIRPEESDPKLIFHPLYPLIDGVAAKPAHPLMFKCKVCGSYTSTLKKLLEENSLEIPTKCSQGDHLFTLRPARGLVYIKNGMIKDADLDYVVLHSTGINKILRTSEVEMLYGYICLSPELQFFGLIVDLEDRIGELGLPSKMLIRIGRGGSRGFGLAELSLKRENGYIAKRCKEVEEVLDKLDNICVLISKSPTFRFSNSIGLELEPSVPDILEKVEIINKGNRVLSGITEVSGFGLKFNLPRVMMKCADIGSLFFYRFNGNVEELVTHELLGFGSFNIIGFNILEVLTHDPGLQS